MLVPVAFQSKNKQPLSSSAPLVALYFSWLQNLFCMNFKLKKYVMQFHGFITLSESVIKTVLIKGTPLCLSCITVFLEA
jgi:hypothetical protein